MPFNMVDEQALFEAIYNLSATMLIVVVVANTFINSQSQLGCLGFNVRIKSIKM